MSEAEPWRAWSHLAGAEFKYRLDLPGATLRSELTGLEQDGEAWVWSLEQLHQSSDGTWLLVRQLRRSDDPQEALLLLAARSDQELVKEVDRRLGRNPGLVELLGRAGIEVGLAPDDQIEGDEIDDWPEGPPPGAPPPGRGPSA